MDSAPATTKVPLFYQPPDTWAQVATHIGSEEEPTTPQKRLEAMKSALGVQESDVDREAIVDDIITAAHRFAEEHRFTPVKTWAFLSILMLLHRSSMQEPRPMKLEESFTLFRRLVVAHSIQRPPYSVRVFGLEESKLITRFVTHTYFLHYRLYLYVFTKKRLLDLTQRQVVINVAPDIPPLVQGTPSAPLTTAPQPSDQASQQQDS